MVTALVTWWKDKKAPRSSVPSVIVVVTIAGVAHTIDCSKPQSVPRDLPAEFREIDKIVLE
jgi:hypothetical protein